MRLKVLKSIILTAVVAASTLLSPGCRRGVGTERVGALGAPLAVGPLTYTAVETQWRDSIESSKGPRLPKDKFLLVNVSVLNASSEQNGAPLLQIVDAKGQVHPEIAEGDGVTDWMGYLRILKPRESRSGWLLFDAPQGACKLRVSSGGDPENEQTALIELPLQLNPEGPRTPDATGFSGAGDSPQLPEPAAPAKK